MAIPTVDELFRPVLQLSAEKPITRPSATEDMTKVLALSPEEAAQRIPSGATTIRNRTGWAMTYLTKAGLIEKVAPRTYQITALGREFLSNRPDKITVADLEEIPGFEAAWNTKAKRRSDGNLVTTVSLDTTQTPHERIARDVDALDSDLRDRLLSTIIDQSPEFFEQLVLDVLLAMGYGGTREDAAKRLGQAGDEGIDGRINQDPLGLDQILVQAKKYKPDNVITRPQIQAFIGSLAGQGVSKGVFITTSSFAGTAQEFVQRGSPTKIVLVDGDQLIDIMIERNIGVRVVQTLTIKEIDQNYFEEE